MINIFANITAADEREIKYLNYLTTETSEKVFKWLIDSCKNLDKLKNSYQKVFSDAKIILIPKQSLLQKTSFKFSERLFLTKPYKMLKDLKRVEQYFYVYKVCTLDLVELDKALAKTFKQNTKNKENIIVLNRLSRFAQYKDIIYGINSNQCRYSNELNLEQFMQIECKRLCKKFETLKNLAVYYILGTTAVSTKGFSL